MGMFDWLYCACPITGLTSNCIHQIKCFDRGMNVYAISRLGWLYHAEVAWVDDNDKIQDLDKAKPVLFKYTGEIILGYDPVVILVFKDGRLVQIKRWSIVQEKFV